MKSRIELEIMILHKKGIFGCLYVVCID